MLRYMSVMFFAESGQVRVKKEWIKNGRLISRITWHRTGSAKVMQKHGEFLRLVEEKKKREEKLDWSLKPYPSLFTLDTTSIIF